jgi:Zn ribbon nucleic-acid-binding protein
MVETTLEIRSSGDGAAAATIESNVSDETAAGAELVAFAHLAARVISLLGPAGAGTLVRSLARRPYEPFEPPVSDSTGTLRAIARFIDGSWGPRMYFRLKSSGSPDPASSVMVALDSLLERGRDEEQETPRVMRVASLLARLGATGQVRRDTEFDVALAAADVAWRLVSGDAASRLSFAAQCPACGNDDSDVGFELRLWPSDSAAIRRCRSCGAGLWLRESHAPRLLREDVWSAMESLRAELGTVDQDEGSSDRGAGTRLLVDELKRVFAEHGWPYTEVRGAPVLLSELSGPAGQWSFYAHIVEEKDVILLYSVCPERIPEGRRTEVSHFLTRANYGLAAGNFELDFDDGEVRYKTVLHLHGDELDGLALKRLVRANGIAMETYLPGIRSVVAGKEGRSADLAD